VVVCGSTPPGLPIAAVDAARELRSWGAGAVLASLGAEGAVLVDDDGVIVGSAPVDRPRSAVGAGDALLAGFLAAGAKGSDALAEALAWGAAAVSLPGSRMPGPADLQRHRVHIQATPAELEQDHIGQATPAELEQDHIGQATPAELEQPRSHPPDELRLSME
jgi:hypothetical protein